MRRNKFKFYSYTLVLSLLGFSSTLCGQLLTVDSLTKKFNDYRKSALQEKIFVHTDRSFYLTGEIVWFKLYYVDGAFHRPLSISKVAYVEILDREKKAVVQTKIALREGGGDGSVFLPASLSSGNYTLRAYTRWMRNFSPDFYFEEIVTIVNPFTKLLPPGPAGTPAYDAQFFPEGGSLIDEVASTVGFRVIDTQGKGIDFKGAIVGDAGDTVVQFRPLKFGIGIFKFTPRRNQSYTAVLRDRNNRVSIFRLPAIATEGYAVHLSDTAENIRMSLSGRIPATTPDKQFFYLLIHNRQSVSVAEKHFFRTSPGDDAKTVVMSADALIDKRKLGEGISRVTIFNADMLPVCERLLFQPAASKLIIDGHPDQAVYAPRTKVSLEFRTHDAGNQPLASELSIAACKVDSLVSPSSTPDIGSYLLLTSELRGSIESPGYYFNSTGDTVVRAIDNLMLTHGWSRFTWPEVLKAGKRSFEFIPEYRGHLITGRVLDDAGNPGDNVITFLSSPGKNVRVYPARANYQGRVQFEVADFFGPHKIVVQTNTTIDSTHHIELSNPFSTEPPSLTPTELQFPSRLRIPLADRSLHMQVQNTFNEEKHIRFTHPPVDSISFYGKPDEQYLLDDYTRFPTMEEVLREYVPGVVVRKRHGKFRFMTLDIPGKNLFRGNPIVLLDGVPVFDIDRIMSFDPHKVRQLEVLTRRYFLGPLAFQGIASFTTYHGDLSDFEPEIRSLVVNYEGLQLHREFYSPRYDLPEQRGNRLPDARSLAFWQPNLRTSSDGKAQCVFYTPDAEGKYRVQVHGMTAAGLPASTTFEIEVKGNLRE